MAVIYAVASGKGGAGKSTFVCGVSQALSYYGKKVLAVDCDIGLRSLDLLFQCSERVVFDWGDYILGRCEPENTVIEGSVDVIAAPRTFDPAFTSENLRPLLDLLSGGYDYIFLDSPAGIGSGFRTAAGCADRMTVITTPDPVCARSCERAVSMAEQMGISDIKLVVNMFEIKPAVRSKLLNIDSCIDETGAGLLGVVPLDRSLTFSSVTGEEIGEFSPASQAFYRIARRILGENVPLVCE